MDGYIHCLNCEKLLQKIDPYWFWNSLNELVVPSTSTNDYVYFSVCHVVTIWIKNIWKVRLKHTQQEFAKIPAISLFIFILIEIVHSYFRTIFKIHFSWVNRWDKLLKKCFLLVSREKFKTFYFYFNMLHSNENW